jgi:hypothetical protein
MLESLLVILLVLMLIWAFPSWMHRGKWGYYPSGRLNLALFGVAVLLLLGRL